MVTGNEWHEKRGMTRTCDSSGVVFKEQVPSAATLKKVLLLFFPLFAEAKGVRADIGDGVLDELLREK